MGGKAARANPKNVKFSKSDRLKVNYFDVSSGGFKLFKDVSLNTIMLVVSIL